jgi:hypothetical protein
MIAKRSRNINIIDTDIAYPMISAIVGSNLRNPWTNVEACSILLVISTTMPPGHSRMAHIVG